MLVIILVWVYCLMWFDVAISFSAKLFSSHVVLFHSWLIASNNSDYGKNNVFWNFGTLCQNALWKSTGRCTLNFMRRSVRNCLSLLQKAQKFRFSQQSFGKAVRTFTQNSQQHHNFKSGTSAHFSRYFTYAGAVFSISLAGFLYNSFNKAEQEDLSKEDYIYADEKKAIPPYLNSSVFKDGEHPVYRIVLTGEFPFFFAYT